jgi:uncharacterized membrane protein YkvA (DUF1232 family)
MTNATDLTTIDAVRAEQDERLVRRRFWSKLRANLHRIPFLEDLLAAFYCATDPATPFKVKAMLFAALAYFIMPFDGVPDWLLVAGFTDDAAVLAAAIQAVRMNLKPAHYDRARARLQAEKEAAGA